MRFSDVFPCGMVCRGIRGKGMALSLRAGVFPFGLRMFSHAVWFAMEFAERAWPYPYVLVYSHAVWFAMEFAERAWHLIPSF